MSLQILACPLIALLSAALLNRRTPLLPVVLLTAGLAGIAAAHAPTPPVTQYLLAAIFGGLVVLAGVDARTHRLPNHAVLTAALGAGALTLTAGLAHPEPQALLIRCLALGGAGLLTFGALAALGLAGFGDAKLAFPLGLLLGLLSWQAGPTAALLAFVLAGPFALAALIRRQDRHEHMPFGPFMVAATTLTFLLT